MSDEDLANHLDNFTMEDEPEMLQFPLGWKFWCKAIALALTAPLWGPVLLLIFGIAQLWPQNSKEPDRASTPKYCIRVITEDGQEMGFMLNAPPKRAFVDRREETVEPNTNNCW